VRAQPKSAELAGLPEAWVSIDDVGVRAQQQEDPRLAAIPVIVVTAIPEAHVAGATLLKKPLRLDALAGAMNRVFDGARKTSP
jgi:hypothetical protein